MKSSVRIETALATVDKPIRGSYRWELERILKSDAFTMGEWQEGTQRNYRDALLPTFRQHTDSTDLTSPLYGVVPVQELTTQALQNLLDRHADKGQMAAAKVLGSAFRAVFGLLLADSRIKEDISLGLRRVKISKDSVRKRREAAGLDFDDEEHGHCWTQEQVAAYRRRWPIGTKQRLALELAIAFGLARVDLALAGMRNISLQVISGTQVRIFKYHRKKTGVEGVIEVPQSLWDIIIATKVTGTTTFLVNRKGKPYSAKDLGSRMSKWAKAAGLPPECTSHGLRRRFATNWADHGVSAIALQHMGAWKQLAEAEKYIQAANKVRLAIGATALAAKSGGEC